MSVYSEYLDHTRESASQPNTGRVTDGYQSADHLKTGLLMRAVICLAFIGTGAVFSLI